MQHALLIACVDGLEKNLCDIQDLEFLLAHCKEQSPLEASGQFYKLEDKMQDLRIVVEDKLRVGKNTLYVLHQQLIAKRYPTLTNPESTQKMNLAADVGQLSPLSLSPYIETIKNDINQIRSEHDTCLRHAFDGCQCCFCQALALCE